jgi:hypothetical protein
MKNALSVLALALLFPMIAGAQEQPAQASAPAPAVELHTYRLTFTLTESDLGKRVGVQHVSLTTTASGPAAIAKIGSRIPIATGNYSNGDAKSVQTQMTYLDVGVNIRGQLHELGYGVQVTTKIEQSTLADGPPATPADPVIRQASIDSDAILTPGKPMMLGSLDIPGSTRHTDIALVVERVR